MLADSHVNTTHDKPDLRDRCCRTTHLVGFCVPEQGSSGVHTGIARGLSRVAGSEHLDEFLGVWVTRQGSRFG